MENDSGKLERRVMKLTNAANYELKLRLKLSSVAFASVYQYIEKFDDRFCQGK